MKNEELQKLTTNIQNKLGENAGLILDDLGTILTDNTEMNNLIENKEKEIEQQKNINKQLQATNVSLFQQVALGKENNEENQNNSENNSSNHFSLKSCFDEQGRFKK